LPLAERLDIATTEIERLNQIETQRGYLTDEEQKKRRELVETYKQTSEQIIKEEQDRFFKIRGMQIDAERIRIKLQGESVEQIKKAAELERIAIDLANTRQRSDAYKRMNDALGERDKFLAMNLGQQAKEQEKIANEAKKELDAIADLQNQQLDQLEADTIREINDFNKKVSDEQRKSRVDAAKKQIDDLEKQKELELLNYEEGTEGRLQTELEFMFRMQELQIKFKDELELNETEIAILTEKNLQKRDELYQKYYEGLAEKAEKNRGAVGPTAEDYAARLKELTDGLKAEADLIENNAQRNLALQLVTLEKERNDKLLAAKQNIVDQKELVKSFEDIDKDYNKKRTDIENEANKEIINQRILLLQELSTIAATQGEKGLVADLEKQIADLKLKLEELNKTVLNDTDKTVKETGDKYKELVDQTAGLIQGVSDNVFNVLNAQVQAYIEGLDKAIDKSKSALDEIRANSENYNAQQLEIEKERLEKLENERAKAVEREKTLGQIQVAINAAIAVSKAAVDGGGFATAFTIAATLASLIAGLAQARVAAGNAFFHGVEYLERGNNKAGRDTIPAMLNEGERVITTDTNNKYWDVLSAVHNNRIPADVLNSFANAYQSGGLKAALGAFGENVSLSSELGNKSIFVNVAQTYQGMENRLERIEAVLTDLPKYMPRTVVSANANGIFKIVEQRQRRKNFSSNWSK
jgi:hypothetical protein